MKVVDVMTNEAVACDLNSSLANPANLMWDNDCGILPVLKDGRELVGLITDRDICMAAAMKDRNSASISVEEVITGDVYSTMAEDDVHSALQTMRQKKVRRLPVVDDAGRLKGILSMNDIVLKAEGHNGKKLPELSYNDVMKTYKVICEHPAPMTKAASTQAGG